MTNKVTQTQWTYIGNDKNYCLKTWNNFLTLNDKEKENLEKIQKIMRIDKNYMQRYFQELNKIRYITKREIEMREKIRQQRLDRINQLGYLKRELEKKIIQESQKLDEDYIMSEIKSA